MSTVEVLSSICCTDNIHLGSGCLLGVFIWQHGHMVNSLTSRVSKPVSRATTGALLTHQWLLETCTTSAYATPASLRRTVSRPSLGNRTSLNPLQASVPNCKA